LENLAFNAVSRWQFAGGVTISRWKRPASLVRSHKESKTLTGGSEKLKIDFGASRPVERQHQPDFWPVEIGNRTSPINRTRNIGVVRI
jgi:hypothetical protein